MQDAPAPRPPMTTHDAAFATRFARLALDNVVREYPNKQDHVIAGPDDVQRSRVLHPAFYGSFDWHSCVHMHWLLARLRRLHPALPERAAIDACFDAHLAPGNVAGELAYLEHPEAAAFERTYGWAWLLKLAEELLRSGPPARRWADALAPLAAAFAARFLDYLPRAQYPWRYGLHANSAFALAFALDYARAAGADLLEAACSNKARAWFGADRDVPARWEPSGADFLSPALMEAELMRRVLAPADYRTWLTHFLPGFAAGAPAALFAPVDVRDRSDGHLVHLDGLNLSRAWCLRGIAAALPAADPRRRLATAAAAAHLAAGGAGLDSGDYVGAHWLATFALLAATGADDGAAKLAAS